MQSQEQKLNIFLKTITDYAEKQRIRILSEMDEQSQNELGRAEKEALSDAYRMIQRETADVRAEVARDLASRDLAGRRKLFEQRRGIEEKVFAEAAKRLARFTSTTGYADYLKNAARRAAEAFGGDGGTVFCVRENDMKYADVIKAAYGGECTVRAGGDITLGGLLALSESRGVAIDATLDSRLEDQHEWFGENAELPVN